MRSRDPKPLPVPLAARRASPRAALLVFTLGPEAESRRRRLLPRSSPQGSALHRDLLDLHRTCLDSIVTAGQEIGCEIVICSPAVESIATSAGATSHLCHLAQAEGPFGRRIERAIDDLRARLGDDIPILLVGTDVPDLDARHLQAALAALDAKPAATAVGACPDGGFYLLGFRGRLNLAGIRWQSRSTRIDLEQRLRRSGRSVIRLAPLGDLDHPADLAAWLASARQVVATSAASALGRWAASFRSLIAALTERLAELTLPLALAPLPVRSVVPAARPWSRPPPR